MPDLPQEQLKDSVIKSILALSKLQHEQEQFQRVQKED